MSLHHSGVHPWDLRSRLLLVVLARPLLLLAGFCWQPWKLMLVLIVTQNSYAFVGISIIAKMKLSRKQASNLFSAKKDQ